MRVTILGCGGSGGVPLIGGRDGKGDWGDCDLSNPRNRRTRSSILIQKEDATLLIDASPDLRMQLLDVGITDVSAVLFTHSHADHIHGIDEFRALSRRKKEEIDVFANEATLADLRTRFAYIFYGSGFYPATLRGHVFDGPFAAAGIDIRPFDQRHGDESTVGFRIDNMAYSTDVESLDDVAFAVLDGVELWIVDCLRMEPHPTHAHFARVLEWVERVRPRRTVLTHLGTSLDYDTLRAACPEGVEPAFDMLTIEI